MTPYDSPKQSESLRISLGLVSTCVDRFPVSFVTFSVSFGVCQLLWAYLMRLTSCDVSPSSILTTPTLLSKRYQYLPPEIPSKFCSQETCNPFSNLWLLLSSWRTIKIDKRRALCASAACVGDSRKWLSWASWHPKGRQNSRSVSEQFKVILFKLLRRLLSKTKIESKHIEVSRELEKNQYADYRQCSCFSSTH